MTVPAESGTALLCLDGPQAGLMVGMADIPPPGYVLEGPDTHTFYDDYTLANGGYKVLTYPARYVFEGAAA